MSTTAEDDAALLRRTAAGDLSAFDTIVDRHEAAVHRFVMTLGGDDVDDVLQETFISAWRSAASYHGTGTVRSWLLSIARNIHRHQVRDAVRQPANSALTIPLDALAERAGWGRDPAEQRRLDTALARDVLVRAFRQLMAEEREVLVLRELEGYSGDETAAALGLTVAAMKSRLHRARLHLAAAVRQLDSPHPESGGAHGT